MKRTGVLIVLLALCVVALPLLSAGCANMVKGPERELTLKAPDGSTATYKFQGDDSKLSKLRFALGKDNYISIGAMTDTDAVAGYQAQVDMGAIQLGNNLAAAVAARLGIPMATGGYQPIQLAPPSAIASSDSQAAMIAAIASADDLSPDDRGRLIAAMLTKKTRAVAKPASQPAASQPTSQ